MILQGNAGNIDGSKEPEISFASHETVLMGDVPVVADKEAAVPVAPAEVKRPIFLLNDKFCKELFHPHLFLIGKFGYNVKRDINLSASKYFNQRNTFLAHAVFQRIKLNSQISIVMRKVLSDNLTAGMLSRNFKETVRQFIANDKAYNLMNSIKSTPAYWKKVYT